MLPESKATQISQDVINRHVIALNEINESIVSRRHNYINYTELCAGHRVNVGLLSYAVRLGYISRIKPGLYKSNTVTFQPIHARKCIEYCYASQKKNKDKKARDKKSQPNTDLQPVRYEEAPMPTVLATLEKPIKTSRGPYNKNKIRTVSILWGLVKFQY